ncbi:MAG: hypothetical protein JOY54_17790 [Acidobacteriaceae bacterium]|nr:hypothetical protein [Acidobacteriaceae bacterium]
MARSTVETPARRRSKNAASARKRSARSKAGLVLPPRRGPNVMLSALAVLSGLFLVWLAYDLHVQYTFSLQSPIRLRFQWPLVVEPRTRSEDAYEAQIDQRHPLTAYQQYACRKFGSACRVALAIQRAENPQGKCEIYHYNSNGTLDWGYFQINTVHLQRPGLNLRDLLDCKANIDFAYELYIERQGFTPWSTYNSGAYRKFLHP